MQLFFVFFGLPAAGVKPPEIASIIAMVVNLGAYAAEIVRAGLDAAREQIRRRSQSARPQSAADVSGWWCYRRRWPKCGQRWSPGYHYRDAWLRRVRQISTEELSYAANLIQSRNFRVRELHHRGRPVPAAGRGGALHVLTWVGPRFLFGASNQAGVR